MKLVHLIDMPICFDLIIDLFNYFGLLLKIFYGQTWYDAIKIQESMKK